MYLQIPFFYRTLVDLVDGTRKSQRIVLDSMEIEIPEISQDEAPLALSYEDSTLDWTRRRFRIHDGEFFSGFITRKGRESTRKLSAIKPMLCGSSPPLELIGFLANHGAYPFRNEWQYGQRRIENWWRYDPGRRDADVVNFYEVTKHHDDARERRIEKVKLAAKGLIGIDGWLHFRTVEPTLLVGNGGLTVHSDFGPRKHGAEFYRPDLATVDRVRISLNEMELAETCARIMSLGGETRESVRDIDIILPEAFKFDTAGHNAMVTSTELVRSVAPLVGELPARAAAAWLELRSLVEKGERGDIQAEALVDMAAALATWKDFVPDHFEDRIDVLSKILEGVTKPSLAGAKALTP